MALCRICQADPVTLRSDSPPNWDLCGACADKLGVRPLPPPCRPARPCMRCDRMQFVRVIPRELTTASDGAFNRTEAAPMALTLRARVVAGMFGRITTQEPDVHDGAGYVETYVCTTCGFVEWYCLNPRSIPLGPEYMADLVEYTTDAPFR